MRRLALALLLLAVPAHALTVTTPGQVVTGTINDGLYIRARGVTVRDATVTGDIMIDNSDYVTLRNVRQTGPRFWVNKGSLGKSKGLKVETCTLTLGRGVTSGEHILLFWDDDSTTWASNRVDITIEAGLPSSSGGEWHFSSRNKASRDNRTVFNLRRPSYAVLRYRSDVGGDAPTAKAGCFSNTYQRDTVTVLGGPVASGSRLLMNSSATCNGTLAGCVGQWDVTMENCLFDASAVPNTKVYWQGGSRFWTIRTSTFRASGVAFEAFDIDGTEVTDCTFQTTTAGGRAVALTNEYPGLPGGGVAGSLKWCRNNVVGTFYADPVLKPMTDAMGLNCGAPVPPPTPTPTPTPTDTVRVTVKATGLPLVITVTK